MIQAHRLHRPRRAALFTMMGESLWRCVASCGTRESTCRSGSNTRCLLVSVSFELSLIPFPKWRTFARVNRRCLTFADFRCRAVLPLRSQFYRQHCRCAGPLCCQRNCSSARLVLPNTTYLNRFINLPSRDLFHDFESSLERVCHRSPDFCFCFDRAGHSRVIHRRKCTHTARTG